MKKYILSVITFIILFNLAACVAPNPSLRRTTGKASKIYSTIFGIIVGEDGKIQSVRLVRVTDPLSDKPMAPVNIVIPERYIKGVKELIKEKGYEPKLENGKPKEFFTFYYHDPQKPEVVITELK